MSCMKCPFCNGELVGTIGHPICRNQNCVMCDDPMPQELLYLLECTRKQLVTKCNQLEIAVDALDRMAIHDSIYDIIARNAMKRIKELEQKE